MKIQTVYIPTKVEEELPESEGYYKTEEEGTSYFDSDHWFNNHQLEKPRYPIHWLKPTETYVFTPEELKQLLEEYTNKIIENVATIHKTNDKDYTIDKESITSQLSKFLKELGYE